MHTTHFGRKFLVAAAGLTPSPLEGEGWGEGAMGGGASIGLERERPPLPQPLPLKGGGEKTQGVSPKRVVCIR